MSHICVFASSTEGISREYYELANALGKEIGRRGHTLVYGGADKSLMGEVARSAKLSGARTLGIIPRIWANLERIEDERIVVEDIDERKKAMGRVSDGFITLPGGHGTLDELQYIIASRQAGAHQKPLVILDNNGFYKPYLAFLANMTSQGFSKDVIKEGILCISRDPIETLDYIERKIIF